MSRIEQLSIQGIRNFSPENPEVIRFEPPVTLILGKNGSGKTTIIESLKYATTGEMPAGTNKGQNFIHDPKLSTNKMSIGNVKLQFSDEMNNKYIVSRSMEARFVKSKIEFKGTDGTISMVQGDGKLKSHKSKNLDLNTFISNALGVSKALLNNVLFCHQEDSNWPLDEAKKVKDKFDDIFNTTRYVKCQDEIRKQINEVKSKMKSIESSVERYKMRKDQADEYREDLRRQSEKKESLEKDMNEIQKDKTELEEKYNKARDQFREAERIKGEINNKKRRLEELERNRADLESDITRLLSVGIEELQREIEKFELTKREREEELSEMHRRCAMSEGHIEQKQREQKEKLVHLGKLQLEEEQHGKRIAERDTLLLNLAKKYQWSTRHLLVRNNEPLDPTQINELSNGLAETLEKMKSDEHETKSKIENEERAAQAEINRLREECVRLEQDIKAKDSAFNGKTRELSDVNKKLNDMAESSRQVEILTRQYDDAQRAVQEAEQEVNLSELSIQMGRIKEEKGELEGHLDSSRIQLRKAIGQKEVRTKLEVVQKDLSSKKTQERRLLSRETVEEAIKILVGDHSSHENLLSYYNSRLSTVSDSLSKKRQEITKLSKEIASVESDMRNSRKQLEVKQSELNGFQSKIKNLAISSASELDSEISRLDLEIEELEDNRGLVHGSERMYHHFIDKMSKKKDTADCPLCHREFDDLDETQVLIDDLKSRVEAMPAKKADFERKIAEKRSKHSQLLELRPLAGSATKLAEVEIPRLETELRNQEERFSSLDSKRQDLEESIEFLRNEEDIGKKAHQDIIQLENLKGEIRKLQTQVESLTNQLGSQGGEIVTVEEAQSQVESVEAKLRAASNNLDALNNRYNTHQRKLAELKQRANQLMERKLQLDNALQQRGNLAERKGALEREVDQFRGDLEDCRRQLQPKLEMHAKAESALREAQKSHQFQLNEVKKKVDDLDNYSRHLKVLEDEIRRWVDRGKEFELKRSREEVERLQNEASILETQKKEFQEKISDFQLALINFENEERNLRNNLKLIVNKTERNAEQAQLVRFNQQLEGLKVDELVREINQTTEKLERYNNHLSGLKGQLQEIRNNIQEREERLQREEFVTAEQSYLENLTNYQVHQAISEDLANFYNALESALMKFHRERMNVINRMVREMWHSTYKGKDIDYIELRAEESLSAGARRQYNYRVVMVKSGVEMDMRGRCSAGQKVLASLIIRMALAEAFSSKCGVLALDEPTTNLDEDNIASLSDTILELSNAIARQKRKFQLIIITHDEKFLERMSRDKRMEKFYRVDRNRFNLSEIRQYDVMGGTQSASVVKKMLK